MDRKAMDAAVFAERMPDLLKVWEWCKRHSSKRPETVTVPTGRGTTEVALALGQFVFGRHSAAKEIPGLSANAIRRRIEKLVQMGILTIEPTTHHTIVTLCSEKAYKQTVQASVQASVQAKQGAYDPVAAELPFTSDRFRQAWTDFCRNRLAIKHPLNELSARKTLIKCEQFGESTAIEALDTAVENDWRGIFRPKGGARERRGRGQQPDPDRPYTPI